MSSADYKPTGDFRRYMPDLNQPRFQVMKTQDAHEYAHAFKTGHQPPWLYALYEHWRSLYEEPYTGITNDGTRFRLLKSPLITGVIAPGPQG